MGITLALKQEDGTVLAEFSDERNVLHRILPEAGDRAFPYLSCVDWYGDTVFNKLQAPRLIEELRSLRIGPDDAESKRIIGAIIELATRVKEGTHLYLVFVGD